MLNKVSSLRAAKRIGKRNSDSVMRRNHARWTFKNHIQLQKINIMLQTLSGYKHNPPDMETQFAFQEKINALLNNPQITPKGIQLILSFARGKTANYWGRVRNGQPPEKLPEIIKQCASVIARKALFAYGKIKEIVSQTKKPTITIYILSTAYPLSIETLSDQFIEQGLTQEEIYNKTKAFYQAVKEKFQAQARLLSSKVKAQEMYFKILMEATMEVGKEWLDEGRLTRFTYPIFLKIPCAINPSAQVAQKLRELAQLAAEKNYDIIFIDHSTVRTQDAVSPSNLY